MQTIYLVRHALKEKAIGDVPITSEGIKQAELTAHFFKELGLPIQTIVSSPLRRTIETARYISMETGADMIVDHRLRERANWGDLPGQTFEEFVEMWERCTREPDYIPPVGDSASRAGARLRAAITDLAEQHEPGSHIVLVTHGGVLTDFMVSTFSEHELNTVHPNFIEQQSHLIAECSITTLTYNGKLAIDSFATTTHLVSRYNRIFR